MAEWSCSGLQIRPRRFDSDLSLRKKMKEESIILVSGGFDPVHIGHIEMFNEASKHGKVVVIANTDEFLIAKKGYFFMPLDERLYILKNIEIIHKVYPSIDKDETVIETIKSLKNKFGNNLRYFANGGDRKNKKDVPESLICEDLGIEMLFGIGGDKRQSSSNLVSSQKKDFLSVEKPWGNYKNLFSGKNFLVKKIEILSNQAISLQSHEHRDEHWIIIQGKGKIQIKDSIKTIETNEHIFIPKGTKHRIFNEEKETLEIIELQYGDLISEEDIKRFKDLYNRD